MKKILSVIASLAILANTLVYPFAIAYAQEETPIPEPIPVIEETVTPSPEPTVTPTPTVIPEPTPTESPSQWTFENVELNKEYQNGGVTLTFTKLPSLAGNIKIEEITLTPEQIQQTGSLSDKAYDITSDMKDGEFTYNLSLPIPDSSKGKSVEVKFAEELSNIASAEKVDNSLTKTDTSVSVANLDHFTIFVVTLSPVTECAGGAYASGVCYPTIQQAIDNLATVDGNTISVSTGTYVENVNVTKDLTLQGVAGTNLQGQITISHDGVTIDNFDITNPNVGYGIISTDYSNLTITNNTIHNIGTSLSSGSVQSIGIISNLVDVSNITISGNTISNIGNLTLVFSGSGSAKGIYLGNSSGTKIISNVTINNNNISNVFASTAAWTAGRGAYGILVNHKTTGLQITNNTIGTLEGLWAHAIGLEGDTPSAVLNNNTISGLISHKTPTDAFAIYLESNASKNTVSLNSVTLGDTSTVVVDDDWAGYDNNPVVSVSSHDYIFGVNAFATIQNGITVVSSGGTVNVATGTYPERIVITKPLNLIGAGVGNSIIDATSFDTTGNVIDITGLTGNTKIEGFDINTGNLSNGIHSSGGTDASGKIEILNNHIIGNNYLSAGDYQFGIIAGYGDIRKLIVSGNQISNTYNNSILVEKQAGETEITSNILNGAFPSIFFMTYGGMNITTLQKVNNNTIDMALADPGYYGSAITFNSASSYSTGLGKYTNISITGNTIQNLSTTSLNNYKGIHLVNDDPAGTGGEITGAIINGNQISGTVGNNAVGIKLSGKITSTTLTNNIITGLSVGLLGVSDNNGAGTQYPSTTTFSDKNSLSGNTVGVNWPSQSSLLNATNNWWGDASGPFDDKDLPGTPDYNNTSGTGSPVTSYVDYKPWFKDVEMTTLSNVAPAVPTLVNPADGSVKKSTGLILDWSDVSDPSGPVTYKYKSSWSGGNYGPASTGTTSQINASGSSDRVYSWQVQACDSLNNCSDWSGPWAVTVDSINPTVDLIFPIPGSSATSFQAVFSENVVESEAENPANYFLNNWPGAGGSGNLLGDATISYDSISKTATVSFTNLGWYISPEQQWGVENIHDLAGNLLEISPYSEYSTPMIIPTNPGTPSTGSSPTNLLTQNWTWANSTDIDGSGVKGYWQSIYDVGGSWSWLGSVLGTSTNLTDGEWQLWLKAEDNAGNQSGEVKSSTLTVDTIVPAKPTGLKRETSNGSKEYQCGDVAQRQTLIPVWDDMSIEDSTFDHYEYVSFTPSGSIGTQQNLSINRFNHSWVPTADGTNGFAVRSVDKAGNTSDWALSAKTLQGSCQITYDSTVPTATVIYDNTNWTSGNVIATLNPSESVTVTNNSGSTSYVFSDNGTFTFEFVDNAGNTGTALATVGNIDTTAPTDGSLVINGGDVYTNSRDVNLTISAQDSLSGVNEMSIANSNSYQAWMVYSTTKAWQLTDSDGEKTVRAKFRDVAGNETPTPFVSDTIILDRVVPTSQPTLPLAGYYNDWNGVVSGTASDDRSGVNKVEVSIKVVTPSDGTKYWDGNSWEIGQTWQTTTGTTNWSYTITSPIEGTYTFYSRATDNAGNIESTGVLSGVVYDITDPDLTWTSPTEDFVISGTLVILTVETDNLSGIDSVVYEYKRNDGLDTYHVISSDWDTTGLALDTYTLRATVKDNAGNEFVTTRQVGVSAVVSNESGASSTYGTATITWTTDRPTKSRVVYDTVSHGSLGVAPNYGYAYSTGTFDSDPKTTSHSVTITGLSDGTVYYYRTISEGSPAAIGDQKSYRTLTIAGASSSSGGATGGQVQGVSTVSSSNNSLGYNLNQNQTNGNEEVLGTETQNEELSTPKPSLIPEVKGTATNNWNARNIALISFGSALIILALLLLWRKSKK